MMTQRGTLSTPSAGWSPIPLRAPFYAYPLFILFISLLHDFPRKTQGFASLIQCVCPRDSVQPLECDAMCHEGETRVKTGLPPVLCPPARPRVMQPLC